MHRSVHTCSVKAYPERCCDHRFLLMSTNFSPVPEKQSLSLFLSSSKNVLISFEFPRLGNLPLLLSSHQIHILF